MATVKKTVTKKKQALKEIPSVKKTVSAKPVKIVKPTKPAKTVKATKIVKTIEKKQTTTVVAKVDTEVSFCGMKKEYLKNNSECNVTFKLPKIAAPKAKSVCLVGEFNEWNIYANPMKKGKDGSYTLTLKLKAGKEYQFRYFIDECKWENDWNADKYVQSPVGGSENSVVVV